MNMVREEYCKDCVGVREVANSSGSLFSRKQTIPNLH